MCDPSIPESFPYPFYLFVVKGLVKEWASSLTPFGLVPKLNIWKITILYNQKTTQVFVSDG